MVTPAGVGQSAAVRVRLWGPVAAWMAFLFAVSSQAVMAEVPGVPDWVTHGGAYAALAVLVCRGLAGGLVHPVPAGQAALAVAIAFSYGVTDELHQSFVPGRHADAWDLVKNLGGALAGAGACAWPRGAGEQRRKAA